MSTLDPRFDISLDIEYRKETILRELIDDNELTVNGSIVYEIESYNGRKRVTTIKALYGAAVITDFELTCEDLINAHEGGNLEFEIKELKRF